MTKSILKVVAAGIAIGAIAFFMPKLLIGIFIFAILMRLIFCRTGHGHCGHQHGMHRFEMADKIRSMSETEYAEFKNNHSFGCCNHKSKCQSNTDGKNISDDTKVAK
jgi:hypothetical protein